MRRAATSSWGKYWEFYRDQLHLPDFGKDSQDRWATQLIRECHALDDIEAGHIFVAIGKCCKRWASFEGAGYGQRENSAIELAAAYRRAGGLTS
jgi:muramidase (phage lysozyme)